MIIVRVLERIEQDQHAVYEITDNFGATHLVEEFDLARYRTSGSPDTDAIRSLHIWLQTNDAVIYIVGGANDTPAPDGDGSLHLPDLDIIGGASDTPEATGLMLASQILEVTSANIGTSAAKVVTRLSVKIINNYSAGSLLCCGKVISLSSYASGDVILFMPYVDQTQVIAQMVGAVGGQCRVFVEYQNN